MKLIQDWPQAYKWWSVHGALTVAILSALYAAVPLWQALISPTIYATAMTLLGLAIVVLRVIQQPVPQGDDGE